MVGLVELGALEKGEILTIGKAPSSFVTESVMGIALGAVGRFLQSLGTSPKFFFPAK